MGDHSGIASEENPAHRPPFSSNFRPRSSIPEQLLFRFFSGRKRSGAYPAQGLFAHGQESPVVALVVGRIRCGQIGFGCCERRAIMRNRALLMRHALFFDLFLRWRLSIGAVGCGTGWLGGESGLGSFIRSAGLYILDAGFSILNISAIADVFRQRATTIPAPTLLMGMVSSPP